MSRIQKYKIIVNPPFHSTAEIFCDAKKRKVGTLECKQCQFHISVRPDKEEIICNAELTETA